MGFPQKTVEVWKTQKLGVNRWKTVLKVLITPQRNVDISKFSTLLRFKNKSSLIF